MTDKAAERILRDMRASGSWDTPTLDRAIENISGLSSLAVEDHHKGCAICGFTIDTRFAAVKPSVEFSTRGRHK